MQLPVTERGEHDDCDTRRPELSCRIFFPSAIYQRTLSSSPKLESCILNCHRGTMGVRAAGQELDRVWVRRSPIKMARRLPVSGRTVSNRVTTSMLAADPPLLQASKSVPDVSTRVWPGVSDPAPLPFRRHMDARRETMIRWGGPRLANNRLLSLSAWVADANTWQSLTA